MSDCFILFCLLIYLENPCNGFLSGVGVEGARLVPGEVVESGDKVALVFDETSDRIVFRGR